MGYRTLNPATGERIESFPPAGEVELEAALDATDEAFRAWRRVPVEDRCERLARTAGALEEGADELARMMALEMGKPLPQGRAEVFKCAAGCRFYAEQAPAWLADSPRPSDGAAAFVRHEPLGPLLAIMPWNFPFWQFYRFAAPALAAGNTVLLKPAPGTPRCGLAIERIMRRTLGAADAVRTLFLTDGQAADVIRDPRVRGVTLTGSTDAGRAVGRVAGEALKPIVLELGGSDPFVVLDDADLDLAVRVAVAARCQNSGQSCIAAKRFLIQRPVFDEFVQRFVEAMRAQTWGDPCGEFDLGPLAREDLRDRLACQVDDSVRAGARVLCGGEVPATPGFYYPPTVLVDVPHDCPAAREELFGPVAVVSSFDTDREAIDLANDTEYGLAAGLWTGDAKRAAALLGKIEAGAVFVNGLVKSAPTLPFGGVKASGHGRELSREGLMEFVNLKTVWIG
ncbi:MAG: NAD-dependent succinate-semialdehyde dehydrogenase [bacterium]|nr:NAD-dependent succinate-semialdehyde dehydrogenase [bacterium]